MPTDYQFTGQKKDGGTGLYYYGARYYDPVTGRFVSADTIVLSPGNPQALNRYSYVYNNPVKYTDPSGHMVGCGAGDDTCGYSDPPTDYSPAEKRQKLLYDFGTRAKDAVVKEGMNPALAFVNLTYLAADLNRSNMPGFVSDLDCIIDGHCWGPDQSIFTIGFGPQFASIGGWLDQNAFPGTGSWSPDYHDNTGNQMYHFWFYVAVSYFDDPGLALLGNAWHDPVIRNPFFQLFGLGEPVYDLRDKNKPNLGVSLKDYDLGVAGAYLGWALRSNLLSPEQVPPWIRFTLTQAPARFGRASQ
jgi:RHS repeat-associated protein